MAVPHGERNKLIVSCSRPSAEVHTSARHVAHATIESGMRQPAWIVAWLQEGLPTVCLGVWIWMTLAPTPADAKFLAPLERDHTWPRRSSRTR